MSIWWNTVNLKLPREPFSRRTLVAHVTWKWPAWADFTQATLSDVSQKFWRTLLGALGGTPTAALETMSGIPPLMLRLEEAMMLELMRIMQKPVSDPLRVLVTSLMSDDELLESQHITPIHIKRIIRQLQKKEETILPVQRRLIPTLADTALPMLEYITITDADPGSSKQRSQNLREGHSGKRDHSKIHPGHTRLVHHHLHR